MKKFGFLMCAFAAMAIGFTSCDPDKGKKNLDDIVENGFYVIGDATGFEAISSEGAVATAMAGGLNEVDGAARSGMFEKYIVLEGGKNFQLVKKEGSSKVIYGATLAARKLATDGDSIDGYFGALTENATMKVEKTGFYHIILDLCEASSLPGGPQIVVAPADGFGIAGSMNSWGSTAANQVSAIEAGTKEITWTWNDVVLQNAAEFKFKHSNCWKINLDDAELVKANTNLGKDMVPNGANLTDFEPGMYTIELKFKMAKGDIKNSFSYTANRTGDLVATDYSNCHVCVVGDAVAEQEGAETDPAGPEGWTWGHRFDMGTPAVNGTVYTWTASVQMVAGGCKIRSLNANDTPYIECGADGGGDNITIASEDNYNITFTIDGITGAKTISVVGGAPIEYVDGVVYVYDNNGNGANLYSFGGSEMFGGWPGAALGEKKTDHYEVAYHAVKGAEYHFIVNGNSWQTNDSEAIVLTGQNIKVTTTTDGDGKGIVVENMPE